MSQRNVYQQLDQLTNDLEHAIATTQDVAHRQHAAALRSVVAMHYPRTYWSKWSAPELSFTSRDELEAFFDGETGTVTAFDLCNHCMMVEEGAEGDNVNDIGYATSMWPCGTIKSILNVHTEVAVA